MIYGIGTDIINIERVEQILNKNKDGFVRRVLSEHEQAHGIKFFIR
jgi:holo-[acyl-carrier protein] synthase